MAELITPIQYANNKGVSKQYVYRMLKLARWRKANNVKTIAGKHFFKVGNSNRVNNEDAD